VSSAFWLYQEESGAIEIEKRLLLERKVSELCRQGPFSPSRPCASFSFCGHRLVPLAVHGPPQWPPTAEQNGRGAILLSHGVRGGAWGLLLAFLIAVPHYARRFAFPFLLFSLVAPPTGAGEFFSFTLAACLFLLPFSFFI